MKKMTKWAVCALAVMTLATGCSSASNTEDTTAETSAQSETEGTGSTAVETLPVEDMGEVTKLGEYKGIEVERVSDEVTAEEIESYIQSILDANPEYVAVDRAAAMGDMVNIDYVGMKDGVAFDGGTEEGRQMVLGEAGFIDGFESGIVGAKKGDELSLNLTFPENYGNAELAGQDVVFDVTVNSVEEQKDAELNEAFVQRMSDFNTVDEFRADVETSLKESRAAQSQSQMQMLAMQKIMDDTEVTLNEETVESEIASRKEYYRQITQMYYGIELPAYLEEIGSTEEEFDADIRTEVEDSLKMALVMDSIIKAEGIEADDAGREALVAQSGMELDTLISSYGEEYVNNLACQYKVLDFIMENAEIK